MAIVEVIISSQIMASITGNNKVGVEAQQKFADDLAKIIADAIKSATIITSAGVPVTVVPSTGIGLTTAPSTAIIT